MVSEVINCNSSLPIVMIHCCARTRHSFAIVQLFSSFSCDVDGYFGMLVELFGGDIRSVGCPFVAHCRVLACCLRCIFLFEFGRGIFHSCVTVEILSTTRCYLLFILLVLARAHSPEKTKMLFSVQAVANATEEPRSGASAVAASTVRPVCKRARHDLGDDESNEPGLVTKLARYHDRSDEESFPHYTSSDASMSGDGSISDGMMSLDEAMDVESPRGEKRKHTSTTSCVVGSRKRRGLVDPMDVDYIPREVKNLTSDCALNGRYWTDFEDEIQCADLNDMELEVPYCTRLARRNRSNERSRRTLNLNFDSEEELGDDDSSVMSDLTTNLNEHTGADTSNPEFDGLDVQAVDALAEILQRVDLSDNAMEIDDDDASILFNDYIARSVLVIPQSRRIYFTRSITTAIRRWEMDRRQDERIDIWAA